MSVRHPACLKKTMAKRSLPEAVANPCNEAKHPRSNLDESKKLLDAIPLVHWRMRVHKWEWLVETTDMNLSICQRGIERMQRAPPTHLEIHRGKLLTLARETLGLMDECLGAVSSGKLDCEIEAMQLFMQRHGSSSEEQAASNGEIQSLDNKLLYYARVKDAKTAQDRDELLAEKMRVARALELPLGNGLKIADAVVLTTDLLERARSGKELILTYSDVDDAKDLFRIQSKPQLKNACRALKRRNYNQLWQSASCSACLEQKLDTFQCDNLECAHHLCSECFANAAFATMDEQYNDLEKLKTVALLSCCYCRTGTMPSDICRAMPAGGLDALLGAVEAHSQSEKARDVAAEKTREAAAYRCLPSSSEKLFQLEKHIISEMIAVKCQRCLAPFGSFDACCALTCSRCNANICALCLASFDHDEATHSHVATCAERPESMTDALFLDLDAWHAHMAQRQQAQIRQYLSETDLPRNLTQRLLDFFAPPP